MGMLQFFDRVSDFYRKQHLNQTFDYVQEQRRRYLPLDKKRMSIWEAFVLMEEIVDESDPDTDSAQIVHAYQTAEACRKRHPEEKFDWFHLAGFIHDLGKVLAHPSFGSQPQWAVVGDTFPVGCAYSEKNVYPDTFAVNPVRPLSSASLRPSSC
jgi:inositol oxygenase